MKEEAKCPAHADEFDHVKVEIECDPEVKVLVNNWKVFEDSKILLGSGVES